MVDRDDFAEVGVGRRSQRVRTAVRYAIAAYERSVPILDTLREAAASDTTAYERLLKYDEDRHELVATGVGLILGHEPTPEVVDAVLVGTSSPTLFDIFGLALNGATSWTCTLADASPCGSGDIRTAGVIQGFGPGVSVPAGTTEVTITAGATSITVAVP